MYSGGTPKTSNKNYYGGNIPFIKSGEINNTTTSQCLTEIGIKESSAKKVNKGDLLFALYGATSGEVAISKIDGAINQAVLKIDNNMNKVFQYNYFIKRKSQIIRKYIQGGQGNLSAKIIKNLEFYYPTLNEQEKIANFLSVVDKKIELMEKTLVLYEKYKKQLQNEIFNKKLIRNELKSIKLKDICTIKKGKQLNKSDMVETGEYYVLNGGKNPSGFTNSWNVNENTITISEGGNSCGYVSFNTEKFYCGGHCYYLTITSEVDNYYLFNYLKFIELKIMRLRVGSGLPNIQKGDIENLLINLPPITIQEEISLFFKFINNYILLKENEKEKMINFKKALLQQMFI